MGDCTGRLTAVQQHEITELMSRPLHKRIDLLISHYGLCEDCALHIMATTLIALFKLRQGSTMSIDDTINAIMSSVSKVYDIPIVAFHSKEELDEFTNDLDRGKMH